MKEKSLENFSKEELIERIKQSQNTDPYERDGKGKILNTHKNIYYFLNTNEEVKDKLKYNSFLQRKEFDGKEYTDFEMNHIYAIVDEQLGIRSKSSIDVAISEIFNENKYNPVIDYLNSLEWDGTDRIERLFIDLLDADDTELNRKMTIKWFMAAVKRVFNPGCKFDNMIVLRGGQGIGKSTICERISKTFFSTISLSEIGNKDIVDKLSKTWIAIIDEMDTFNRKEMSTIKTFLSTPKDSTRLAYERNTRSFERHCVFIGSTNDSTFLRDSTSSVERRFWVIDCKREKFDKDTIDKLTPEFIDQLWAEAVHKLNDDTYLDIESELLEEFSKQQTQFKTFNDDLALDYIKEILSKYYDKPKSSLDMYNQYNDKYLMNAKQIDKIPASWVLFVLKKVYNIDRSQKYLECSLAQEWDYKQARYNGVSCRCLIRKKSVADDSELPLTNEKNLSETKI